MNRNRRNIAMTLVILAGFLVARGGAAVAVGTKLCRERFPADPSGKSRLTRLRSSSMRPTACHILAVVFALLTGLLGAPATAVAQIASTYTVTDLGNFFATGVNDSSWVSGYDARALVWRPGLGTHEILGGGQANAINNAGEVAGFAWYPNFASHRAIRWSASGGVVDMGDLPGGGNYSRGYAINAQGWVAGQGSGQYFQHPNFGNQSYQHATLFRSPTDIVELQDLPPGTQNSNGRGINDAGAVVGERNTSTGWRAVYWAPDGTALDLAAEWGGGGGPSFASDINNHGQVAMQLPLATGGNTAAIWQAGVGFTEIGLLPGTSAAIANAINDEGVTVGTAGTAFSRGFAWSLADGVVDLNDRLDPLGGAGWSILEATGISENGLIVGRGYSSTLGYRAVLMTPMSVPEPSTALLLMAGLTGLMSRRVRCCQSPVPLSA